MLVATAPLVAIFLAYERRLSERGGMPLVNIGLFSQRAFSVGLGITVAVFMANAGFLSARSLWPVAYFHEGEVQFVSCVFTLIKQQICSSCHALQERFSRWIKPSTTSLVLGTLADMTRGKSDLLAENAL